MLGEAPLQLEIESFVVQEFISEFILSLKDALKPPSDATVCKSAPETSYSDRLHKKGCRKSEIVSSYANMRWYLWKAPDSIHSSTFQDDISSSFHPRALFVPVSSNGVERAYKHKVVRQPYQMSVITAPMWPSRHTAWIELSTTGSCEY